MQGRSLEISSCVVDWDRLMLEDKFRVSRADVEEAEDNLTLAAALLTNELK
jgi:hypothetical protein